MCINSFNVFRRVLEFLENIYASYIFFLPITDFFISVDTNNLALQIPVTLGFSDYSKKLQLIPLILYLHLNLQLLRIAS